MNKQRPDDEYFGEYEKISEEKALEVMNARRLELERLLILAKEIATEAHKGQYDKGGTPYIIHPVTVAESLESTEHKIVALLHDVFEDSTITADDLRKYGFAERIIKSVEILTKIESQGYEEYLSHVREDDNARHVKMADIKHNMDISRIPNPSEKDYARIEKYKKALSYLEEPNN